MIQLEAWVERDHAIEAEATSKTLALMEHRWRAIHEAGFGIKEFARALGHTQHGTVAKYVHGWELWQSWGGSHSSTPPGRTPLDALELARMSEVKRAAVEVVSEAKGISASNAARHHAPAVQRARDIIETAPDREAGIVKAREHTERVQHMRERRTEVEAGKRSNLPRAYIEVEYELDKARRALQNAIGWARGHTGGFDPEAVELMQDSLARVRSLLDLMNMAIIGEVEVDWDAELARIQGEGS